MQLFYSLASPYARFVRTLIHALGIENIVPVLVNPFDNSPALLAANPLAQIPCLLLDDGTSLFDSEVIARYLDAEYGQQRLFGPATGDWAQQCQFSLIKGILDSAVGLRQEQMREEEGVRSPFWTGRYEQAIMRGVMQLELLGIEAETRLSARQLLLVCLFEYLDFRHPQLPWRTQAPSLAAWLARVQTQAMFTQTRPDAS
ncbi:glutathione S-transferase [Shewanella salipaludis]|uniref:Glutathione S-transferase n=1 Tax=Shewanella salipaludis TaxID=2723052 RepID=A0A972FSK8_9GAMM|nr:glutathione S-transferase [Shewanella salipaludis]NMH65448.1 glutathione S-transferase [Shewanella salipaludis]